MVIGYLSFDDLERVVADVGLRDFQAPFQCGGVFAVDHHEVAVRVVGEEFEQGAEVVEGREEG